MAHGDRVRSLQPIVQLRLDRVGSGEVLTHPSLTGLYGLNLAHTDLTDDTAVALAESEALRGLRWLKVGNTGLGQRALDAICAHLPDLAFLDFTSNLVNPHPEIASEGPVIHGVWYPQLLRELEAQFGRRAWMYRQDEYSPDPPLLAHIVGLEDPGKP